MRFITWFFSEAIKLCRPAADYCPKSATFKKHPEILGTILLTVVSKFSETLLFKQQYFEIKMFLKSLVLSQQPFR